MEHFARALDGGPASGPLVNDPLARRARTFQCRDALWESLEQIAGELECSVDYLVNDALKHYVRQRLTRHPPKDPPSAPARGAATLPAPAVLPSLPLTPSGQYRLPEPPPLLRPPPPPPLHLAPPVVPPPPLPARMTPPPPPPARPQLVTAPRPPVFLPYPPPPLPPLPHPARAPTPPLPLPAPLPPGTGPIPAGFAAPPPQLSVIYADHKRLVDRPRFVIGRGKAAGLAIKDPNISREHAVIEQQGGIYYLVDVGSTNGTFVNGERITRKAIADGDVATICEHQVRFSFERPRGSPGSW
jgi:hypothetical protein